MLLETEIQNRLLGVIPSHEQQLHYATIFRLSPDLAFAEAYVDGWLAALKTIEEKCSTKLKVQYEI